MAWNTYCKKNHFKYLGRPYTEFDIILTTKRDITDTGYYQN